MMKCSLMLVLVGVCLAGAGTADERILEFHSEIAIATDATRGVAVAVVVVMIV